MPSVERPTFPQPSSAPLPSAPGFSWHSPPCAKIARASEQGVTRRPLLIRGSRFSTIRNQLLSFDSQTRLEAFDFSFTRIFGVDTVHAPAPVRVHVLILLGQGADAFVSAVGFSFPLCGSGSREWTTDLVSELLREQAVEFSHHLGDLDVIDVLASYWALAQFYVAGQVDNTGVRHLVVRVVEDLSHAPEYVCIFEDNQSEWLWLIGTGT